MTETDYGQVDRFSGCDSAGMAADRRRLEGRWSRGLSMVFLAASSLALWGLIAVAIDALH